MMYRPPRVSVIVPVYNTGEHLEECLLSILDQQLADIEVLCVDDGSTDDSPEILQRIAQKDQRVRLLPGSPETRGPGAGRNKALREAQGEYCAFVDSDDHIHPEMLSEMLATAEAHDSDTVMCLMAKFGNESLKETWAPCTYQTAIPRELDGRPFTWEALGERIFDLRFASCNKIYRREFLLEREIFYGEDMYYEDLLFTFRVFLESQRMSLVRKRLYFNRKQREGATTFIQGGRVADAIRALDALEKLLDSDPKYGALTARFVAFEFDKLRHYLHKNDADHIGDFYERLRQVARRPELEGNPYLSEHEQVVRQSILDNDVFGFVVWDYWNFRIAHGRARRQLRRQRAKVRATRKRMREIEAENEQLRSRVAHLEGASPAVPATARGRAKMVLKAILGPNGARAARHAANRLAGRGPTASPSHVASTSTTPASGESLDSAAPQPRERAADAPSPSTQRSPSRKKKPPRYVRESTPNLYDAADLLRTAEVERRNAERVGAIRRRLAMPGEQLRVGFLVSSSARWNCQVLYSEMQADPRISPRIVLSQPEYRVEFARKVEVYREQRDFFLAVDPSLIELFDEISGVQRPIEDLDLDVIFYEMPWGMKDYPRRMLGRALNVYMHYGFMMMANHEMHYNIATFHSYLWAYYTQTEDHRRLHLEHDPSAHDRLVVTGYPKLDVYLTEESPSEEVWEAAGGVDGERPRVIYAPHHSLGRDNLGMSTFAWMHEPMLDLLLGEPDVQWAYKPHPSLRFSVEKNDLMSSEDYAAYEALWQRAGNATVVDTGNYFDLFRTSDALVTDCGSFLAEYLPTGKPIIWLVSEATVGLNPVGEKFAEGFYAVRSRAEFEDVFDDVVRRGNDPLRERRQELANSLFPARGTASHAVLDHLRRELLHVDNESS
jgi:glycosyltransferase involved in cell wall biosynthesis/CDP-glycerol glycerophosphotransferase (TagB/SpsB family)